MNTFGNLKAVKFFKQMVDEGIASSGTQEYLYAEKTRWLLKDLLPI